ncbi:MAG: thioredoxin family protein [Ignavibacteriales bacterium]|jgi:predicted thioredoxin/glutaredoxin|nr:thioredoxin family protein [Ignavibacteriales bacterium]
MTLTLFVTENCTSCEKVEKKIRNIANQNSNISYHVDHINRVKQKGIFIAPALFIQDELYAYGDFDSGKLLKRISEIENSR